MKNIPKRVFFRVACMLGLVTLLFNCSPYPEWKARFESVLHQYGHRNWIIIADYAYPSQSASGIETIATGQSHREVLNYVLNQIENITHIKPLVLLDKELSSVSEDDAPRG